MRKRSEIVIFICTLGERYTSVSSPSVSQFFFFFLLKKKKTINHENVLRLISNSSEVQTTLVRSSWGQLFTLGLAQCAHTLSLPSILTSIVNHLQASIAQEKITASKVKLVTEHICRLQDCVSSLHKLQVDATEFAYLKALTLFSAGEYIKTEITITVTRRTFFFIIILFT